jgi:asparagine synthase (glutamine-hydrolysing)
MCGLFASVGRDADIAHLRRVDHRGPDGEGWRLFNRPDGAPVRLGHKRLSIIDPGEHSNQPFEKGDGRYHIIYNGMIYNYETLRAELQKLGHEFRTSSDTEVLLSGFIEWGQAVTERLNGMYVFVIYDAHSGDVFGARDRFGMKPLYYLERNGAVALASEIKQIYDIWEREPLINKQGALDFLIDGLTDFTPETMFAGIKRVPPGHKLTIKAGQGVTLIPPQSDKGFSVKTSGHESTESLHDYLEGAVESHLRQDATIGFCLSGGLDSGSLVLKAKNLANRNAKKLDSLRCVTASFPDTEVDETHLAAQVADSVNAEHICVTGTPSGLANFLSDIVYFQDEPFPSTSIYVQWTVFKKAQDAGLRVMMDGQGADEMMFGYHHVFPVRLWDLIRRGKWNAARQFTALRGKLYGAEQVKQDRQDVIRQIARSILPAFVKNVFHKGRRGSGFPLWVSPEISQSGETWINALRRTQKNASFSLKGWRESLIKYSCLPMLLRYEDRNSMAHSIEARLPFLDDNFANFCLTQPNDFFFKSAWTKWPLRDPKVSPLPAQIREKAIKIGFAAPEDTWLRHDLKDWLADNVRSAISAFPDLFNSPHVSAMVQGFSKSPETTSSTDIMVLYRIAIFFCWTDKFNLKAVAPS